MRAYIPDFQNFLLWLEGQNFKYVILREPEIYSHGFPKPGSKQDVDLLVDDDAQRAIEDRYGKGLKWRGVKCDIYSLSGKGKGSYHGHPYFPVDLGKRILNNRRKFKDLFFVPSAQDHYDSLLYHIVYQKAEGSKIGFDDASSLKSSKYFRSLQALSTELGTSFPQCLLDMHRYLVSLGLSIPNEWLQLDVIEAFRNHRKSFFQAWLMAQQKGEFNSFVIRKTAKTHGKVDEIVSVIKQNYEVMLTKDLGLWDQKVSARKMRGNKWRNGGPPIKVVLVFDPDPQSTSEEDRKVHPFVLNNRQFFKRAYREQFLKTTKAHRKANPIHSTDNEAEAIGHLPLFFSDEETKRILEQISDRRHRMGQK